MNLDRYCILAVSTVIATLFLIFVGGLVRASGAGLGCPDWPTCFGKWIPPVSPDVLPAEFDAEQFNPVHTWLEYINRLTGVIIGLLIAATFVFSFRYRKSDPVIVISAGVAFALVLFQGWLGGQVVQTRLSTGIITLHMITAMVIVNVLLYTAFRATRWQLDLDLSKDFSHRLMAAGIFLFILVLVQMVLGTQVREMVDIVKNVPQPPPRADWLDHLSGRWVYPAHRSFSWLIVIATGALWWMVRSGNAANPLRTLGNGIVKLVILQIGLGLGMEWLDMPGSLQVLHLTGGAMLICTVFLFLLLVGFSRKVHSGRSKVPY